MFSRGARRLFGTAAGAAPRSTASTVLNLGLGTAVAGAGLLVYTGGRESPYYHSLCTTATPAIRLLDPETSHAVTIRMLALGLGPVMPRGSAPELAQTVFGLDFPSPVGVAAGFDKQGEAVQGVLALGAGFLELGGVTPQPQPGNARPRMWRCEPEHAVINCFGLNSDGHAAVVARLEAYRASRPAGDGVVGVNLAKNTSTPSEKAAADYAAGMTAFGATADFVVLNVSCPNVAWRGSADETDQIIQAVVNARKEVASSGVRRTFFPSETTPGPRILLKVSPDMDAKQKAKMAAVALKFKVDGLVVANTTTTRPAVSDQEASAFYANKGGLSGRPLKALSLEAVRDMYHLTKGKVAIIGCGGIADAADAYKHIRAGASLVELYTAMVYAGPAVLGEIHAGLAVHLARDGFASIAEAVGADHR